MGQGTNAGPAGGGGATGKAAYGVDSPLLSDQLKDYGSILSSLSGPVKAFQKSNPQTQQQILKAMGNRSQVPEESGMQRLKQFTPQDADAVLRSLGLWARPTPSGSGFSAGFSIPIMSPPGGR